jgi:hypothetical protein
MKALILTLTGVVGLLSLAILTPTGRANAQMPPERQITPSLPPAPKFNEARIDAEMAKNRYFVSDISTFAGRADSGRPGTQIMTFLRPGHWAVAVFTVFGNCEISVSYKTSFKEPDTPADTSLGFPVMTFDTTGATSSGIDVMIKVTNNTPQIGCPYRVKAYIKS